MDSLLERLTGGDRRSTGCADEVAAEAEARPELLMVLLTGLDHADPLVRMRSADALEKATRAAPERLQPFAAAILAAAEGASQQEVRWHAAQLIGRLEWTPEQQERAVRLLYHYLQARSRIVVTFSLQALADLAQRDPDLMEQVRPLLSELAVTSSGAVRSRAARLLAELGRNQASAGRKPRK